MIVNPPPWPNGARCAVAFTLDVDAETVVRVRHGGRTIDEPHALAHMRYDPLVGLPRLLDLFGGYGIPITCFVPGRVARDWPEAVLRILDHPNEIAHHGDRHDWPSRQSRLEEAETLQAGIEALQSLTGRRPEGWRAPYYALSRHSLDLLAEAGFLYESSLFLDDVPVLLQGERGSLWELPVPATLDDYNHYVSSRAFDHLGTISPPRLAREVFQAEFDAMWEWGGLWVAVWHPAVSGRPAQALAIRGLIEHMLRHEGVWFATLGDIARHARALQAEGRWSPRIERLPFGAI